MPSTLKLPLIIALSAGLLLPFAGVKAQSEPAPAAAPVTVVESRPMTTGSGRIVVELFSSQACVFCPQADALFAELVKQDNVIGLACHVDYFDVRTGSLSRPFCTARQTWYMQALGAGPNYTPQMVINGAAEVVGYKAVDVQAAVKKVREAHPLLDIAIEKTTGADEFALSWNAPAAEPEPAILWLMMIDKPHDVEIAEGRNKGRKVSYVNIMSDIEDRGVWNPASQRQMIRVAMTDQHSGFAVIAQGKESGKILAAGQYRSNQ